MKKITQRKSWMALVAILFLFAACKGESPTAPPSGNGGQTGGGTPPPTGATLTLTASNTAPLVDSSVVVTATVTENGNPVPNGTAVQFVATGGGLDGTSSLALIKTTTNGVATVTLTSTTASVVRVSATINNVTKFVDISFKAKPVVEPPPSTTPTITSVSPALGAPSGGQTIHITGTNFKAPVRVLFDVGGALPIEAFVVSVTETGIDVITPPVNLGAGQQLEAGIIVLTQAGTANEQRVSKDAAFTFRNDQLTPIISTASPNSGPVTGGTRVTIFGEGFQAPVQVLFGAAEARVITVEYSQIIVESPTGSDTADDGSGAVTGPVSITVRNINSNTTTTMAAGFRYVNAMQITAVGPTEGPFTGGTRVEIDGTGFVAPVAVTIGGVAAQPISVSGTKIIALTSGISLSGCGDQSGVTSVTNIVNGDTATGVNFTYRVPPVSVVNVTPAVATVGTTANLTVAVANAQGGVNRIKIGDKTVFPSAISIDPITGLGLFTVALPTNFEFPTVACTDPVTNVEGESLGPLEVDITYQNATTGCTDTATKALTIIPADTACHTPPAEITTSPSGTGTCADAGNTVSAAAGTASATITVTNTGGQNLSVTGVTFSGQNNVSSVSSDATTATIAPGSSQDFTITIDPTAAGAFKSNVTFATNVGSATACVSGTATP